MRELGNSRQLTLAISTKILLKIKQILQPTTGMVKYHIESIQMNLNKSEMINDKFY